MKALECCGQFMTARIEAPGCAQMHCERCGDIVYIRSVESIARMNAPLVRQ